MEQYKIDRINALARKAKTEKLPPEEAEEQKALREEYLAAYRLSLRNTLEHTVIEYPDGHREPVKRR